MCSLSITSIKVVLPSLKSFWSVSCLQPYEVTCIEIIIYTDVRKASWAVGCESQTVCWLSPTMLMVRSSLSLDQIRPYTPVLFFTLQFIQASSMQDTFYWGFLDIWWQSVCLISHLREDFLSALSIYSLHVLDEKYVVSVKWPHISAMCKSVFLVVCVCVWCYWCWQCECEIVLHWFEVRDPRHQCLRDSSNEFWCVVVC